MALPSLTLLWFVAGLVVVAYGSTFLLFGFIRIFFGVSIQRLWWSGLRRIAWTPQDGLRIDIRGLRFSLHRPTFSQPTWISVVITELKVTVDLKALGSKKINKSRWSQWTNGYGSPPGSPSPSTEPSSPLLDPNADDDDDELEDDEIQRSRTWQRLTQIKERIKRLHRKINWLRMVDLIATNSSLALTEVGTFQISQFTIAVDTRPKTVDRSRLFQHRKEREDSRRPAEWIFTARSLLFSADGVEFSELLDYATLNVHGMLSQKLEGLRDASISLKLGRLSLPYDDLNAISERMQKRQRTHSRHSSRHHHPEASLTDIMEELDNPGTKEEALMQTVSDSREFIASILRGIQEFQFAVSYVGLSKRIHSVQSQDTSDVYLNLSMKEIGVDLLRLDPQSPAHLMYFSRSDVAHQALVTAISISVGIDDGQEHPERLLYIPLATATLKTTLPSKAIQLEKEKNAAQRNTNMLFANLVVTSPSVDLDPKHLPLTLAILERRQERPKTPSPPHPRHHLISRLLPKAVVKISIHEPVIRVSLPCMEVERRGSGEFDLLISAMSSMSLDLESSHSSTGELHYSLSSSYRVTSHQLYYQTASGEKHNLHISDSFEVKVQVSASPNMTVTATGNFQTFSVYMIRPEISEGVRQIVVQLHRDVTRRRKGPKDPQRPSFLRRVPSWLHLVQLQGSDFNFEVAGVDSTVSDNARGASVHLESWTAEYKADRTDDSIAKHSRRRATSRSLQGDDLFKTPSSPGRKPVLMSDTDGRRLAIHTYGLEAFVIESAETCESDPFLSLPRFETAFATVTDQQGPLLHVNSFSKAVYFQYSLYRHFAIAIASSVVRKTFASPRSENSSSSLAPEHALARFEEARPSSPGSMSKIETVTADLRVSLLQIKANMPSEPNLMVQVFGFEAGQHRWRAPFAKAHLTRLYSETPGIKNYWSRVLSLRGMRLDYRHSKKQYGNKLVDERSFDVVTDAIRLAVPHQLVMHRIFDGITNTVKTVQQIHHRFESGTSEYILAKKPEGPKKVPKISLRSQAVLFEVEDGSFEWKLGLIYVHGLQEQRQRLARDEALRLKKKKIEEADVAMTQRRETYEARERRGWHRRARPKRRSSEDITMKPRSKSAGDDAPGRAESPGRPTSRRLRYDAEATSGLSENAQRSIDEAEQALHRFNARSWKKRIDASYQFQEERMRDIHHMTWGHDEPPEGVEQRENIMAIPQRPPLMGIVIHDLNIAIDKPSFALSDYPQYLHKIGKGMPFDMQYALLIPMHVTITMGDARATLRDYPLPLVHIPPIKSGQSARLPALQLSTDFVIAEEYRDEQSIRNAKVVVVPPDTGPEGKKSKGLAVTVRRTVGAVKTYSDISVQINTASPTRITWGASYQPAIQDMMQVIESFLKPPVDPSQRVGFWDKIRLSFHSRIKVAWPGDGDVHLILKGSRDPYHVTGAGAGFVMCWRKDVRWSINENDDPKKFMTVNSGEYVLAIPDFNSYARQALENDPSENTSIASTASYDQGGRFKKTVMKLSGKVQWLAGIVFERNISTSGRSFDFRPHYEVVLKNPAYAKPENGLEYDAFRGFRSHHIHLSIAIAAPVDRDWTVTNLKPSRNYNSVHLTPRFFSHFFSWWSMFSGTMSLPIRQGRLWPGVDKTSKKFGRHLATIKYNLLLSPLYLSHIYKHKGPDDQGQNCIFATGLKVKLDSFMLDLHQRRESFRKLVQANKDTITSGIRLNKAQVDFIAADFRAVSATMRETTVSDIEEASDSELASYGETVPKADLGNFNIPDHDTGWIDMDDFVELDWILPTESSPETQILPLAFAPRFTYFLQTDHRNVISGDPNRTSPFGNEPTHYCVMSARNDPRRVQCDLIQGRLDRIAQQLQQHKHNMGEHELKIVRDSAKDGDILARLGALQSNYDILLRKQSFLQALYAETLRRIEDGEDRGSGHENQHDEFFEAREDYSPDDPATIATENTPAGEELSDFNNRFIIHNVQLKWTNSLRNIILRYIHQVSQRRGFVYYMSRPAVKFILDIVEEQVKAKQGSSKKDTESHTPVTPKPSADNCNDVEDRIQQLLNDTKRFVEADEADKSAAGKGRGGHGDEISRDFTAENAYHVRLIAPQIQLQSEKNTKSAVLVTAKGIQVKVVQIMDKDRITDEVSGLVQRRFNATTDSVQVFVTSSKTFSSEFLDLYSANKYGTRLGTSWPPWVPLEDMFDFNVDPFGFSRVVQRTSASLRYDKFNTLRLKYNDDVTSGQSTNDATNAEGNESRMDHLWVDFPRLLTKCDSTQYYALYVIVLDLLLYSEPLEKTRSETLEKIILASDFSDLSPAPDMVFKLQEKIRTLQEIKLMFQLHENVLSRQQWKERIVLENDLAQREDELFFIMKAITTSQSRIEDRVQSEEATAMLRWEIAASELVWHMVRNVNESLIELQLKDAHYNRTDNTDGSNDNTMEVGKIEGWTLLPNANYPQLIAPFEDEGKQTKDGVAGPMLRVQWNMLEAVAGIPVVERFEVNVVPLRIQLEYDTGMKAFEYVFPGVNSGKDNSDFSPFMIKHILPSMTEEAEEEESSPASTTNPTFPVTNGDGLDPGTGAGDLELRLQPTLTLPDSTGPRSPRKARTPQGSHGDLVRLRHFAGSESSDLRKFTMSRSRKGGSSEIRPLGSRTASNMSEVSRKDGDATPGKRFALLRANSSIADKKNNRSNDLTEMLGRASKFMTLTYVNVASMVLCLSYKGKGQRNIVTDVHDLVFRMPTLEYRNKTWSNLDLVMHLKKEVIRALVSHTGAILSNKIGHHRPTKQQQSRLREMANSSIILGKSWADREKSRAEQEDISSSRDLSIMEDSDDESGYRSPTMPRSSFTSNRGSESIHSSTTDGPSGSTELPPRSSANGSATLAESSTTALSRPRTASSSIASNIARSFSMRRPSSSRESRESTPFHTPPPLSKTDIDKAKAARRSLGAHSPSFGPAKLVSSTEDGFDDGEVKEK
jgi:hypothetical protein